MSRRRYRIPVLVAASIAVAGIGFAAVATLDPRLVYNPSESAPLGWYRIAPDERLTVGVLVLTQLPTAVAELADARGYLPRTVPALKLIAAMEGQEVCMRAGIVSIDGRVVALALHHDGAGRPLVAWIGCRTLKAGEVFFLSPDCAASYDSRYFGPVDRALVIGKATPLWTW